MRDAVYVWELPVRLIHWTIFLSVGVLSITGYYIGDPFVSVRGEAYGGYLMGWMRFVHAVAAFVFTLSVLAITSSSAARRIPRSGTTRSPDSAISGSTSSS
jgi:Ni/Fe-hydrogenase 1 B-type cytochrome subunit